MAVEMEMELLDLIPISSDYVWMSPLKLREELHDIVELGFIVKPRQDLIRANRSIAIVNLF